MGEAVGFNGIFEGGDYFGLVGDVGEVFGAVAFYPGGGGDGHGCNIY